jgi:hypothetical protein
MILFPFEVLKFKLQSKKIVFFFFSGFAYQGKDIYCV